MSPGQSMRCTRKYGSMARIPPIVRFMALCDLHLHSDRCWEWRGARLPFGYGRFGMYTMKGTPYVELAHRAAWILLLDRTIPSGLYICHRCDNPACVRPSHLFLGTARQNSLDAAGKGRLQIPHPGMRGKAAKLSPEAVRMIRLDPRPVRFLAKIYGVSKSLIGAVKTRSAWQWL
jgi:hypothetical protein